MKLKNSRKKIFASETADSELAPVKQFLNENQQQVVQEFYYEFVEMEHLYESAIREVKTKLEILDSEFRTKYSYNPIHHIEDRLKSPESIFKKMQNKGVQFSCDSIRENLNDIAGVRVICNYIEDIYHVAELLTAQDDVDLIQVKDYIRSPKPNGYRSLHLVIKTPVYLSDKKELVNVEVQIRTIAMDFWASLEHELKYKSNVKVSNELAEQLRDCAEQISDIDSRMQEIYRTLKEID